MAGRASPHDGARLGVALDAANTASPVWADAACRSAANIEMPEKRGLKPRFQRLRPRGEPMPRHVARAAAKLAPANLACNFTRFLWLETRQAA